MLPKTTLDFLEKLQENNNREWFVENKKIFENEQKKITAESLGFVLFLEQAKVLDANEREIILDRSMALKQEHINIEEMRWIVMMALWNEGREKDFLFIEDAIYKDHNLVLH